MNENNNGQQTVRSTSTAALQSPTVGGTGFQSATGDAARIAKQALNRALNAKADDSDFAYAAGLRDIESQIHAAQGQKNLVGLGALQSVGDLKNTIFENERKRREQAAGSGFAGPMQEIRGQRDFNQRVRSNESSIERDTENKLRGQNLQLAQLSDQELAQLRGTNAMSKSIAEEIARRQLSGHESGLFDMSHDQGFWGSIGAAFGKDQTYSADLHAENLKKSDYFQEIAKQLGIDLNNEDVTSKLASALKNTVTRTKKMYGIGDVFTGQAFDKDAWATPWVLSPIRPGGSSTSVNIDGKSQSIGDFIKNGK